jgi:N-acetylneuraminic acid mutarotase
MNFPKPILYFLFAFLFLSCNDAVDSPYPALSFQKAASMPGTGRASAVAFAVNGKGYVTLGRNGNPSDSLKDCWQYDPTSANWIKVEVFPGLARVKAVAAVVNGKAYVGLGYKPYVGNYVNGNYKDFWMYDPVMDTWTQKATYPSIATDACVSFVFDNCIYVGEGFTDTSFTNEFWKYNPELDNWTRLNDFPGLPRAGAVVCIDSEHVYFGTGFQTGNHNDWWEYFPVTDSWTKRKAMPDNGRVNAVALCVNDRFFVSAGRHWGGDLTGGHVISDIMEYDASRNVWYERGGIPGGGRENAISFVINGKGYIGFGEDDTQVLNDFWSFEP